MTAEPSPQDAAYWFADEPGPPSPRSRMLTAGVMLLLERGDSAYSVAELVRRAGVALNTFYRSFASKDEFLDVVLVAILHRSLPRMRAQIFAATDDPLDRLRLVITMAVNSLDNDVRTSRTIVSEHLRIAIRSPESIRTANEPYVALVRELADAAAAAGMIDPTDLESDVGIITTMVTAAYHSRVLGLGAADTAMLGDQVWRFCLTALHGTPEAHARARVPLAAG